MMKHIMRLLQVALTGCRDAAGHGELERSRCELAFANVIRDAAHSPSVDEELQRALNAYAENATTSNDEVMRSRTGMYRSLIAGIASHENEAVSVLTPPQITLIVSVLDQGMSLLADALDGGDVARAEIEADHIHNLPSHLAPGNAKSRIYYLEKERTYYLDRIEQRYGDKVRRDVARRYAEHWRAMSDWVARSERSPGQYG